MFFFFLSKMKENFFDISLDNILNVFCVLTFQNICLDYLSNKNLRPAKVM